MRTWKLSAKEVKRVQVLTLVKDGNLTLSRAAEVLSLGYRQAKRVWKRFREQGAGGLAHRARGKPGHRRLAASLRTKVLAIVKRKYADYGPTLAAECPQVAELLLAMEKAGAAVSRRRVVVLRLQQEHTVILAPMPEALA